MAVVDVEVNVEAGVMENGKKKARKGGSVAGK
jgi:hypothetical protein